MVAFFDTTKKSLLWNNQSVTKKKYRNKKGGWSTSQKPETKLWRPGDVLDVRKTNLAQVPKEEVTALRKSIRGMRKSRAGSTSNSSPKTTNSSKMPSALKTDEVPGSTTSSIAPKVRRSYDTETILLAGVAPEVVVLPPGGTRTEVSENNTGGTSTEISKEKRDPSTGDVSKMQNEDPSKVQSAVQMMGTTSEAVVPANDDYDAEGRTTAPTTTTEESSSERQTASGEASIVSSPQTGTSRDTIDDDPRDTNELGSRGDSGGIGSSEIGREEGSTSSTPAGVTARGPALHHEASVDDMDDKNEVREGRMSTRVSQVGSMGKSDIKTRISFADVDTVVAIKPIKKQGF